MNATGRHEIAKQQQQRRRRGKGGERARLRGPEAQDTGSERRWPSGVIRYARYLGPRLAASFVYTACNAHFASSAACSAEKRAARVVSAAANRQRKPEKKESPFGASLSASNTTVILLLSGASCHGISGRQRANL
ncbi:hypothetical protein MTO96_008537 [Rhipicephalus appendiculatus]